MQACIYCLNEFDKADKEHLITRAYGGEKGSKVIVCTECNTGILKQLDQELPNSLDIFRNQLGIRSPKVKNMRSMADGKLYELDKHSRQRIQQLELTIQFSDGPVILEGDDPESLADDAFEEFRKKQCPGAPMSIGGDEEKADNLNMFLQQRFKSMTFGTKTRTKKAPPCVQVSFGDLGGHEQFRAIAKMAFNFLAFKKGNEFARHPQFDRIREYIRYGTISPESRFLCMIIGNHSICPFPKDTYLGSTSFEESFINQVQLFFSKQYRNILAVVRVFKHFEFLVLLSIDYEGDNCALGLTNWPLIVNRHDEYETDYLSFLSCSTDEAINILNRHKFLVFADLEKVLVRLAADSFPYRNRRMYRESVKQAASSLAIQLTQTERFNLADSLQAVANQFLKDHQREGFTDFDHTTLTLYLIKQLGDNSTVMKLSNDCSNEFFQRLASEIINLHFIG